MTDTIQIGTNYIVKTADVVGGRPRIDGTRIGVSHLVNLHIRHAVPIEEVAQAYNLTLAQVYAALAYYYDHRAEIDEYLDEEYRIAEEHEPEMQRRHAELLEQAKMRNPELYEQIRKRQEPGIATS